MISKTNNFVFCKLAKNNLNKQKNQVQSVSLVIQSANCQLFFALLFLGWSTKVPNYNPREIVKNLKRMIEGKEPKPMNPWFKNFKGEIEQLEEHKFALSGEIRYSCNMITK